MKRMHLFSLIVVLTLLLTACSAGTEAQPTAVAQGPASAPAQPAAPAAYRPGEVPIGMVPAAERTPEMWMEYLGIRLVETRDSSGPAAFRPKAGDLYFLTNESTTWGATNTRNNLVFIDAKTRTPVIQSNLPDEYSINFGSHGIAASSDGKWIYLPALGASGNYLLVINGQTLKLDKVYQSLGRPHHVNNFTAPDGRELIMVVDFGWNWSGSGLWVLDPAQDNIVVGGMNRADFSGHPYVASGDVNGKYMYATVPAPTGALREEMEGYLAKINLETWKVEQAIPMGDPIWPEISLDGTTAWVTLGGHGKVAKVDLEAGEVIEELASGPGPWGARLSYDGTRLFVADKGEAGGYGQQGRTMTVYDTEYNIAINAVPIGLTTDHIILSPDGKELWATSNADHKIVVVDADTEEVLATIPMPNDGDTHGSTFIQYTSDGNGGVAGEVVSSFTGLRGSARVRQMALAQRPKPLIVRGSPPRPSSNRPGSFVPDTLTVEPGADVTLAFVNAGGTSSGVLVVESSDLGITRTEIKPGRRATFSITTPAQEGEYKVVIPDDTQGKGLTIVVKKAEAEAGGEAEVVSREVDILTADLAFVHKTITVKAGEQIRFVFENRDDEKHNLVGLGEGVNLFSPDVDAGQTGTYEWAAPETPGTYQIVCAYHPAMNFSLVVE